MHYETISGVEQTFCSQGLIVSTHFLPGFNRTVISEILDFFFLIEESAFLAGWSAWYSRNHHMLAVDKYFL